MTYSSPPCPYCGAPLNPNARFCSQCGRTISSSVAPTQRESPAAYGPTQYVSPPEPAAYEPPAFSPTPAAPRRSPWLWVGLGASVSLCLLVACAVGVYLYLFPMSSPVTLLPAAATDTPQPASTATLPPSTDTPLPPPTELPPPSETADPRSLFEFNGLRLRFDPSLAFQIQPEVVPAYTDPNGAPWEIAPEHTILHFQGYPLFPEAFHEPRIIIYPINEFLALRPELQPTVDELRRLLDSRPPDVPAGQNLPFLPPFNAGQVFHTALQYVDFQNGRGLRFLTQYAQAIYPVSSRHLFYTYQGLSNDGRFYVAAVLPVANPILPDENTYTLDDAFMDNFTTYLAGVARDLAAQPPDSFTPNLALLDQMVGSLQTP